MIGMNDRREYKNSANEDGGENVQEKNKKAIVEIEKEQRNLCKIYIKNRRREILLALIVALLSFCYYIHSAHKFFQPFWLLFIVIISAGPVYTLFLEEALFIRKFFEMEKNYYIWKFVEKNSLEGRNASSAFQSSLDSFRRKLLSKVTGFKRNNVLFRGGIFDFRITKVKKEIDIFFSFMIEFMFGKEFYKLSDIDVKKPDHDFEDFLKGFKEIFITHPESLNLVALNNFFRMSNVSIKREDERKYNEIEKDVSEYYTKNEKLIEQRAEQKVRMIESVCATLLAIAIAIAVRYMFK